MGVLDEKLICKFTGSGCGQSIRRKDADTSSCHCLLFILPSDCHQRLFSQPIRPCFQNWHHRLSVLLFCSLFFSKASLSTLVLASGFCLPGLESWPLALPSSLRWWSGAGGTWEPKDFMTSSPPSHACFVLPACPPCWNFSRASGPPAVSSTVQIGQKSVSEWADPDLSQDSQRNLVHHSNQDRNAMSLTTAMHSDTHVTEKCAEEVVTPSTLAQSSSRQRTCYVPGGESTEVALWWDLLSTPTAWPCLARALPAWLCCLAADMDSGQP